MTDDQELRRLIVSLLDQQTAAHSGGELPPASAADGGFDLTSLELVRLLVNLEEHLDVEFDDLEIMNANFDTVDDVVALIGRALSTSGQAKA